MRTFPGKGKYCRKHNGPKAGLSTFDKLAVHVQRTARNQETSTSATTSTTLRRYQVQKKNVKLQFSYKAKKEIVVLYVTLMPGVSHKADVTLEPWKVDQ